MRISVRQTDSELSNLSLNIHRHVEVPKRQTKIEKKLCPSDEISLYMSRFSH